MTQKKVINDYVYSERSMVRTQKRLDVMSIDEICSAYVRINRVLTFKSIDVDFRNALIAHKKVLKELYVVRNCEPTRHVMRKNGIVKLYGGLM